AAGEQRGGGAQCEQRARGGERSGRGHGCVLRGRSDWTCQGLAPARIVILPQPLKPPHGFCRFRSKGAKARDDCCNWVARILVLGREFGGVVATQEIA